MTACKYQNINTLVQNRLEKGAELVDLCPDRPAGVGNRPAYGELAKLESRYPQSGGSRAV